MFLGVVDAVLVHMAYNTTMQSGASVQLVFGFEVARVGVFLYRLCTGSLSVGILYPFL